MSGKKRKLQAVVEVPYYNIAIASYVLGLPTKEIAAWMETKGYQHMPLEDCMLRYVVPRGDDAR